MSKIKNNKGQEEMVGFALILIIVAVIFIILLSSYLRNSSQSEAIENPEVNSFIQSFLQYTTNCEVNSENLSIQKLIFACEAGEICSPNVNSCKVLNTTIKGIIQESWDIGEENPVKGYNLLIFSKQSKILNISQGVVTNNYKGSEQDFGKGEEFITILFNAYS